jgi:hypothetical protein
VGSPPASVGRDETGGREIEDLRVNLSPPRFVMLKEAGVDAAEDG